MDNPATPNHPILNIAITIAVIAFLGIFITNCFYWYYKPANQAEHDETVKVLSCFRMVLKDAPSPDDSSVKAKEHRFEIIKRLETECGVIPKYE